MTTFLNESGIDRIIRVVLGIILIAVVLTGVVTGSLATVLLIVGAVALLTGAIGFCPLYYLLKIRTR